MSRLKISHSAGFFSCCSVKLAKLDEFVRRHEALPYSIDDSALFSRYKEGHASVNEMFFSSAPPALVGLKSFGFTIKTQYAPYRRLNFEQANKWVAAYFSPSEGVRARADRIRAKYDSFLRGNVCSVFYRGNDKCREVRLGSYEDFLGQARKIVAQEPEAVFHVQTDELEFKDRFVAEFPKNSFWCEELPMIRKSMTTTTDSTPLKDRLDLAFNLLAMTYVLSKSKYLITHSGNCGLWAVLYRGHAERTYQHRSGKFI
jgi:hypothetical protein